MIWDKLNWVVVIIVALVAAPLGFVLMSIILEIVSGIREHRKISKIDWDKEDV